jgi:hypothetical protein
MAGLFSGRPEFRLILRVGRVPCDCVQTDPYIVSALVRNTGQHTSV